MIKLSRILFATCLIISTSLCPGIAAYADQNDQKCDEVKIIFARGSGESLNDSSYEAWQYSLDYMLYGLDLRYSYFELGSDSNSEYQYPAVAVAGSWAGIGNLIGAYVSAGSAFQFGASVVEGSNELIAYINHYSSLCPQTKYVLGGYSQGAMVNTMSLSKIDPKKIIYVANFGDPKAYFPEGQGRMPDACSGKNLSDYRAYVSDCHAYKGILGGRNPYQPTGYTGKLGVWCNDRDIMCSSGVSVDDHTSYVRNGLYKNAAEVISNKIRATFPKLPTSDPSTVASTHDLIILFDVSGSMLKYASLYRDQAQQLAYRIRSLGGRVALFTYKYPKEDNIKMICDFSCDAREFAESLTKATQVLDGGHHVFGEPVFSALDFAMRSVDWQIGATKSVAVITASPNLENLDGNKAQLEDIVKLSLSIDPVNVYTLVMHPQYIAEYQELSNRTNGKVYYLIDEPDLYLSEIAGRPIAKLALENYSGFINQDFYFDASDSTTIGLSKIVRYDWDLDCDGIFETQDAGPIISHGYTNPLSGYIQVKVTDEEGRFSTMSAKIDVMENLLELAQVKITNVEFVSKGEYYRVDYETDGLGVLVSLNGTIMGFEEPSSRPYIRVKDITANSNLTLTAYSKTGTSEGSERGLSASVTLKPNGEFEIGQPSQDPNTDNWYDQDNDGDNKEDNDTQGTPPTLPESPDDNSSETPGNNPDDNNPNNSDKPDKTDPDNENHPGSNPDDSGNNQGSQSTEPSQGSDTEYPNPSTSLPNQVTTDNIQSSSSNLGYIPKAPNTGYWPYEHMLSKIQQFFKHPNDESLDANDRRIHNDILLTLVPHSHVVQPVLPPPLPHAKHNKLSAGPLPNIS